MPPNKNALVAAMRSCRRAGPQLLLKRCCSRSKSATRLMHIGRLPQCVLRQMPSSYSQMVWTRTKSCRWLCASPPNGGLSWSEIDALIETTLSADQTQRTPYHIPWRARLFRSFVLPLFRIIFLVLYQGKITGLVYV